MNKKQKVYLIIIFVVIMSVVIPFFYFRKNQKNNQQFSYENNITNKIEEIKEEEIKEEEFIDKNSVKYSGWLKTSEEKLKNEHGEIIQLRGLSSHGIQWFPEVLTYENLKKLKNDWNINVFRIAMYTAPEANGYISHPEESKIQVKKIVEYAKNLDIYVIIDWHILSDNNPQLYQTQSKEFFDEMSKIYSDVPNVIYEICNEPNGNNATWNNNVRPYAEEIVSTIRANSPKALIIVGTPDWCKDLKAVADNPLDFENIIYSCHFYAGTHGESLQKEIDYCIGKKIPIFVSECGITDASGNGNIYPEKFKSWINYLNEKNISWIYWSFCNKDESSSILKSNFINNNEEKIKEDNNSVGQENIDINNYLTESGIILKEIISKYN